MALAGRFGKAYNEDAFRYFLEVERARASRSRRESGLLLVRLAPAPGAPARPRDAASGPHLLAALLQAVRETDIVGWFREGVVAGAILSDRGDAADESVRAGLHRVRLALHEALPDGTGHRLRLRAVTLAPRPHAT